MPTSISSPGSRLLVLGLGFSARRFVERHGAAFGAVAATVRSTDKAEALAVEGIAAHVLAPGEPPSGALLETARAATHVLVSVPPGERGDTALEALGRVFEESRDLRWIGYLSTTGVYGDQDGRWIDENTPAAPGSERARRRLAAEEGWRALESADRAVQVFRLSGIYGPGRNALVDLRRGEARRLIRPGQVFNRIHIDDIADGVAAAMRHPEAGAVFNLADDEPAPQHEVVAFAAGLLGIEPPPLVPFERAAMSEMALSFWAENKRVANTRVRALPGFRLNHPTYREGLSALHLSGEGR